MTIIVNDPEKEYSERLLVESITKTRQLADYIVNLLNEYEKRLKSLELAVKLLESKS